MNTQKNVAVYGLIGMLMIGSLLSGGCYASRLPPSLSAAEREQIHPLGFTVAVDEEYYQSTVTGNREHHEEHRTKCPAYPESLKNDLRGTMLFKDVDLSNKLPANPDLVASVKEPVYGSTVIPLFTILTLGIIPTFTTERHGQVFAFARPADPAKTLRVEYTYESTSVLGWYAVYLRRSPDWSGDSRCSQRYLDRLALAISTNAAAIRNLVNRNREP